MITTAKADPVKGQFSRTVDTDASGNTVATCKRYFPTVGQTITVPWSALWGNQIFFDPALYDPKQAVQVDPKTGNVSVIHWHSRPGQSLQNEL